MQAHRQTGDQADFFDELRFWSRTKLRILEKYVDAYLRKRAGFNSRIYYLDGFAGQGYYGLEGQHTEEGSPLRMARVAQLIKAEGKGHRLICLNSELEKKRCEDLQEALAPFDPELVHVYCGAFADHLPEMIREMGNAPAVCFLDPFGVVGISVSDIRPLLERPDTEILLNLSTPTLHRLAGFATSNAREARGKFNQVSHVLGADHWDDFPEWLVQRDRLTSDEWEQWAARRYLEQMHDASPHLKYGLTYPVRERLGGGVKYYLVFASRAPDAFPIMSDIICTEEDDLHLRAESAKAPGQMSLFGHVRATERERRTTEIIEEIHAFGLANNGINRKRLIEEFSIRYLGEFKQKHFRQMVEQLVREKRARFGAGTKDIAPITFA